MLSAHSPRRRRIGGFGSAALHFAADPCGWSACCCWSRSGARKDPELLPPPAPVTMVFESGRKRRPDPAEARPASDPGGAATVAETAVAATPAAAGTHSADCQHRRRFRPPAVQPPPGSAGSGAHYQTPPEIPQAEPVPPHRAAARRLPPPQPPAPADARLWPPPPARLPAPPTQAAPPCQLTTAAETRTAAGPQAQPRPASTAGSPISRRR